MAETVRQRLGQAWKMVSGLAIIGRYFFRPAVTIRYPEQKTKLQPRYCSICNAHSFGSRTSVPWRTIS